MNCPYALKFDNPLMNVAFCRVDVGVQVSPKISMRTFIQFRKIDTKKIIILK